MSSPVLLSLYVPRGAGTNVEVPGASETYQFRIGRYLLRLLAVPPAAQDGVVSVRLKMP